MDDAVVVHERQGHSLTAANLRSQVNLIQEVMREVMKKDVHYGIVPGTDKPSLYKAGAEKLCMTFRLAPEYEIVDKERDGDHLTITSKCTLTHIPTGQRFGSALGSCSTMEAKYAYRTGKRACPSCGAASISKSKYPPRDRKNEAPGWWCNPKAGGCGADFSVDDPAITGQQSGRVANEDKADQYNTVLKMSNKRALLAAVLNATAASDIFSQDLIDDDGTVTDAGERAAAEAAKKPKQPKARPKDAAPGPQTPGAINATQARIVRKTLEGSGKQEADLCRAFGIEKLEDLPATQINAAIDAAKGE